MRIDRLLVERGLFVSRAKAQAAIAAGRVTANGVVIGRPSFEIASDAELRAEPAHPFVSRGGLKLAAALDQFRFDPKGCICLDVGESAGGFTQVLLAREALRVYAVDVGHGQLHPSLRKHPSVISLEGTDVRRLDTASLPATFDFITVDVSFIPLALVLPPALALARSGAHLVVLIKPQFEAGRRAVKKGIVRDRSMHAAVCESVSALVQSLGWRIAGLMPSPILGGDGNREFLLGGVRD
jgi:23S rRNA (cytidine1920-2'-O)/16S rRNA (cytidine1409-2'-O)-methyltransferase